jgi:hypothetical protein
MNRDLKREPTNSTGTRVSFQEMHQMTESGKARSSTIRMILLLLATVMGLLLTVAHQSIAATPSSDGPLWSLTSTSNTAAAPGSTFYYFVDPINTGTERIESSPVDVHVELPDGISLAGFPELFGSPAFTIPCPGVGPGDTSFTCHAGSQILLPGEFLSQTGAKFIVKVDPDAAPGVRLAKFTIEGGGAPPATTYDSTLISAEPTQFGLDAVDFQPKNMNSELESQAGGHPDTVSTYTAVTTETKPAPGFFGQVGTGQRSPVEPVRNISVDLPPGFVGLTRGVERCTLSDLSHASGTTPLPTCPESSQVGWVKLTVNLGPIGSTPPGYIPVFNMNPPPGVPARFGFNIVNSIVTLDAHVRSGSDYGLTVSSRNISEGVPLIGTEVNFWGNPSSSEHDLERACRGQVVPHTEGHGENTCPSDAPERAFLRNPTSCASEADGALLSARAESWFKPGVVSSASIRTHQAPGHPQLPGEWGPAHGFDHCEEIPFDPSLSVIPTTEAADSPTGLELELSVPQKQKPNLIDQSDLRSTSITLPRGMSVNPSAVDGLGACTTADVGMITPVGDPHPEFTPAPPECPDNSKIGSVEIETPSLDQPLQGSIYLAKQGDNPFGSLLATYLAADDPVSGVVLKLPGKIEPRPDGQLVITFTDTPQLPFEHLTVNLFGGPRATLRTPPTCGSFGVRGVLNPWSGSAAVHEDSTFDITQGPSGAPCPSSSFDPRLAAGTENPLAGTTSPFHLRLSRDDGTQELAGLRLHLPRGLLANLSALSYCSDSTLDSISAALGSAAGEVATPSCPAGSQIGTVTVGAGVGPTPFYTNLGHVYWAGPYKGAPVSIAAVVPALAGPFDLGTVVVRNRLQVNPDTAEIDVVSDPLPQALAGIPLDLRDVRVDLDRPNYTLNPTNCDPKSIDASLTSITGATATRSQLFQVANCDRLGFKPKLNLAFKGATSRRAHPSLSAVYTARPGDANLARAQVKLPPAAFLDNAHIGTVCTRVQFAADACPADSIYGHASATSPILGYPLYGKVYLRSSDHELPDLVADLRGPATQPIEVALAGKTDSVKGALRNTFELVPDAPVGTFRLQLFGGKKGLIQMSSGFCANPHAIVKLDAYNGRTRDTSPTVKAKCGSSGKAKRVKRSN